MRASPLGTGESVYCKGANSGMCRDSGSLHPAMGTWEGGDPAGCEVGEESGAQEEQQWHLLLEDSN